MALDAYSILNDRANTPLGVDNGDPVAALDPNGEEFFIIVATTLFVRDQYGNRHWLTTPTEYVRGGGRP